jgi:hypothetical protein
MQKSVKNKNKKNTLLEIKKIIKTFSELLYYLISTMFTALEILSFSQKFSLNFTFAIFIIGGIGNLLNICVLTTLKPFRSNPCAFYLIVESIVNTCQLCILFIIYLLPIPNDCDPGDASIIWCKLQNGLPQLFRLLSTSMVCFAAFDQFLCTNPQLIIQQKSSLRLARRLLIVAICLWTAHSITYGISYQIVPLNGCIITSIAVIRYYSFFYYPFLHGLLPIFTSTLFSLLAYRNVRHLVRRQVAVVRRRLHRQLTAMIFIRVICFVLLLLPYTIYRIWSLTSTISPANSYPYAIEQLVFSISAAVLDLNYAVRFH